MYNILPLQSWCFQHQIWFKTLLGLNPSQKLIHLQTYKIASPKSINKKTPTENNVQNPICTIVKKVPNNNKMCFGIS
jgi:hypothetical protein